MRVPQFEESASQRLRSEIHFENNASQYETPILTESGVNNVQDEQEIGPARKGGRIQSTRANETEKTRQSRLVKQKKRTKSNKLKETKEQHENRLEKEKDRIKLSRKNETPEQYKSRLEKQKERNKLNREKKRAEKDTIKTRDIEQVATNLDMMETDSDETYTDVIDDSDVHPTTNEILFRSKNNSAHTVWPEPIPRVLKEGCLQKFINQMSMSELAEVACTICNIRCATLKSKKNTTFKDSEHSSAESSC